MTLRTRMPSLWALLALLGGKDTKAEERREAAKIRAEALTELQEAMRRRDTRKQHEKAAKAVAATNRALEIGA